MNRATPVEALVQVGSCVTRYVRAGQGPPVLLLTDEDPLSAAGTALFLALARTYRVTAPAVPATPGVASWLLDLADGLGLDRPAVVVASGSSGDWAAAVLDETVRGAGTELGPVVPGEVEGPGTEETMARLARLRSVLTGTTADRRFDQSSAGGV